MYEIIYKIGTGSKFEFESGAHHLIGSCSSPICCDAPAQSQHVSQDQTGVHLPLVCYTAVFSVNSGEEHCVTTLKTAVWQTNLP